MAFSQELADQLCATIREVTFVETACEVLGISHNTVKWWLREGKAGKAPYAKFYADVQRARADREIRLVKSVETDARGCQWLLEKAHQTRYGGRTQQQTAQALVDAVQQHMSPGAFEELLDALGRVIGDERMVGGQAGGSSEAEIGIIDVEHEQLGTGSSG